MVCVNFSQIRLLCEVRVELQAQVRILNKTDATPAVARLVIAALQHSAAFVFFTPSHLLLD